MGATIRERLAGLPIGEPLLRFLDRHEDFRVSLKLNIRRDGLDGARLMSELRSVAFSAGSACASGSGGPSHVLQALGLTERQAKSSVRLGWGRYSTEEDIIVAARLINEAAGEIL